MKKAGMRELRRIIRLTLTAVLVSLSCVLVMTACGDGGGGGEETPAAALALKQGSVSLKVGEQTVIEVVDEFNGELAFSSSNPLIASVDGNGRVEGLSEGNCLINVKSGNSVAKCSVSVTALATETVYHPVLSLSQDEAEILAGGFLPITAEFKAGTETVSYDSISWTSKNVEIATVNFNGLSATINAVKHGATTVTVQAVYKGEIFEEVLSVYVKADANIVLDKANLTLYMADFGEGKTASAEVSVLSATVSDQTYSGSYSYATETNSCVAVNASGSAFTITSASLGDTVVKLGFTIPDTDTFVYSEVSVQVIKASVDYGRAFFFDVENDESNKFVLAESYSGLNLSGDLVGIYTNTGVKINKSDDVGFYYEDVKSNLDFDGNFAFKIETTTAVYSAKSKIIDRRTGWTKISTYEEFSALRNRATAANEFTITGKYYLANDIDCTGQQFEKILANFNGTLDGNGKIIKNLKVYHASGWTTDGNGIFNALYGGAVIKNLCFDGLGAYISSGDSLIGQFALFGNNFGGTINEVVVRFEGNMFAGIYGLTAKNTGTITNCIVDVTDLRNYKDITGDKNSVSTFIAQNNSMGTVDKCYAYSLGDVSRFSAQSNVAIGFTIKGLVSGNDGASDSAWFVTEENADYAELSDYSGVKESQTAFADELALKVAEKKLSEQAYELYRYCIAQ